jgi:hypothetical protein
MFLIKQRDIFTVAIPYNRKQRKFFLKNVHFIILRRKCDKNPVTTHTTQRHHSL